MKNIAILKIGTNKHKNYLGTGTKSERNMIDILVMFIFIN